MLAARPETVLLVAPRHVANASRWLRAAAEMGMAAQAWSALSPGHPRRTGTRVVVLDVMGELFGLYGLAARHGGAAFLGASLVPLGGQNPVEPAAWGLPACFGPSMEDFADAARSLVAAGAAREVGDAAGLAGFWLETLADQETAAIRGRAGRRVAEGSSRAAARAAELILAGLERKGVRP